VEPTSEIRFDVSYLFRTLHDVLAALHRLSFLTVERAANHAFNFSYSLGNLLVQNLPPSRARLT